MQLFSPSVKNLRFLPPPSSEGGLGFHFYATPVERPLAPYDDADFRHPPLGAPSDEGAVSAADWGRECSVFPGNFGNIETFSLPPSKIFDFCHLPRQREACVSALLKASPQGEGFSNPSAQRTPHLFTILYYLLSSSPSAPSDEGAVNGVDWGRESHGFSGKIGNIGTFSLPPALRATY